MKRKILTILLVTLMIMGSMPVMAAEKTDDVDFGYYQVKALFPDANILKKMGDPAARVVQSNGLTAYKYAVMDPDKEPVQVLERFTKNSQHTLYVYEDGSYMLLGIEAPGYVPGEAVIASDGFSEVINWEATGYDGTYALYEGVQVYSLSGLFTFGFYFDVRRDMFTYATTITDAYDQYSGGNYVYSGSPGIRNSGKQAYQRYRRTELIEGTPYVYTFELRATVTNSQLPPSSSFVGID